MNEFFKKNPIVHYAIVLGLVALLCGLVVGLINYITVPVISENALARKEKAYQEILPVIYKDGSLEENILDPVGSVTQINKYFVSDEIYSYLYIASGSNSYGNIEVLIAVDQTNKIIGTKYLTLNQTLFVDKTALYLNNFVGTTADTFPSILNTGASRSKNLIDSLILSIWENHTNVISKLNIKPYDIYFGVNYDLKEAIQFSSTVGYDFKGWTGSKTKNITVSYRDAYDANNNYAGRLFDVSGVGAHESESDTGELTVQFIFDKNGVLKNYLPIKVSEHQFYDTARVYLDSFIGKTITEFTLNATDSDLVTGSTRTSALLKSFLFALIEVNGGIL
ncbi:MAG: hypothetical protein LBV58_00720 [Acholeplasmatales bacterium]|jgi:hypothetical protein|nr:hypothetical protein [Acholeplasmatales bacterium]